MPFVKGKSGNPAGRVRGAKGRTSEEIRQSLLKLLDDNMDTLQKDIEGMKGKERATLLISLAKHVTPPALNPDFLNEAQLKELYNYFKRKYEQSGNN